MSIDDATTVAFHALSMHIVDHALPAPFMIITPSGAGDARHLQIHITKPDHLTSWLDSLIVDDERHTIVRDHEHVIYEGRLPDLGVRVSIHIVDQAKPARVLSVVSA